MKYQKEFNTIKQYLKDLKESSYFIPGHWPNNDLQKNYFADLGYSFVQFLYHDGKILNTRKETNDGHTQQFYSAKSLMSLLVFEQNNLPFKITINSLYTKEEDLKWNEDPFGLKMGYLAYHDDFDNYGSTNASTLFKDKEFFDIHLISLFDNIYNLLKQHFNDNTQIHIPRLVINDDYINNFKINKEQKILKSNLKPVEHKIIKHRM
ncbi:TPA: hypothetical protein NV714_000196 [Escherichia coli]|nr:hypothetical protein [Escherichia coli]